MAVRDFVAPVLRRLKPNTYRRLDRVQKSISLEFDCFNKAAREKAAERLFEVCRRTYPLGTPGRGRFVLRIIESTFPTDSLTADYFENLEILLRSKPVLSHPGKVCLVVGSGRSGSTSLAALLATVDNSCCTHENPPLIDWAPDRDTQVQFHMRRFKMLTRHYSLVSDASHWWLNALDDFFECFPDGKVIGLFRNLDACARSFMKVKGNGLATLNHWAPYGNDVWRPNAWDATYPTYPLSDRAKEQPDRAKYEMIVRYIEEYNGRLKGRAEQQPDRILTVPTEELSIRETQKKILDFIDVRGKPLSRRFNMQTVFDGEADKFLY